MESGDSHKCSAVPVLKTIIKTRGAGPPRVSPTKRNLWPRTILESEILRARPQRSASYNMHMHNIHVHDMCMHMHMCNNMYKC